jgi:UDP-N-acetylmuramoyl-tripeptide--D-alanyl-D-alanine ligase
MIEMSLAEVAAIVDGRSVGDARVSGGVEFDSRKAGKGDLFVAFVGEKVDGHDFAAEALAAGAAAVLGSREIPGAPMVLVADPLAALAALARAVIDRLDQLTVIGVTGSSGKTTTKDYLAQLTGRLGPTVATAGSLNNELGHPYTVLRADAGTRFLVLEKAARAIGDIAYLSRIAPPRIGVVLNVGSAHVGEFGSADAIAVAKGELVEALPADGLAVLNADDPRVAAMAARTAARVVTVGESPGAAIPAASPASPDRSGATLRAADVTLDERGRPSYTLVTADGAAPVRLGVIGRHQVGNTLAVAAVGLELGMTPLEVAAALAELRPASARRMDVFDRPDGVTVIDDSYNANPDSVAAALRALVAMGRSRRTVAVLGYLAELGEQERAGHERVGRLAVELGVDRVVVVGEAAAPIARGEGAVVVSDQEAAIELLRSELRPGDVVLVKGSRYRTWDVADWLRGETS